MVHKPRIYQLLRRAGLIDTRNDALVLLKSGKVLVNDKPVFNPDFQVNPKKEKITINDKPLTLEIQKKYFILNKPAGYLTSKKRSHGKRSVMELIHEPPLLKNTLFPVGRLDVNSTGLLIITNDGELAHHILRPTHHIEKEYLVLIKGRITGSDAKKLESGIIIPIDEKPYKTLPAKVKIIKTTPQTTELTLTIIEGKKRQVRLMVAALGYTVLSLHRIRIGNLKLGDIPEGTYKEISSEKITQALFH